MTAEVAPEGRDVRGPSLDRAYWRWVSTNKHAALASIFSKQGIWIARGLPLLFPLGFGCVYVLLCACKVLVGLVLVGGFVDLWSVVDVIVKCC